MKLHYRILMESVFLKTSSTLNMEHVLKMNCPVGALKMIPVVRLLPRYVPHSTESSFKWTQDACEGFILHVRISKIFIFDYLSVLNVFPSK